MWIKDNITRTGKEVWYEYKLIEEIRKKCEDAIETYARDEFYEDDCDIFLGESNMASIILDLIASYEGER